MKSSSLLPMAQASSDSPPAPGIMKIQNGHPMAVTLPSLPRERVVQKFLL
jgi:hypothetical protein